MKHESIGEINYLDKGNNIECKLKVGGVKNKPSDCLSGEILVNKKPVSTVSGSFLSYIAFDDSRYWDIRENFEITLIEKENNLPS